MIEHIVLFKWKESSNKEEIDAILHELSELQHKIPGIVRYQVGHNFSSRSLGYHAGISSTFIDQESLNAYSPHPEHQKVYAKLIENTDSILALDFQDINENS